MLSPSVCILFGRMLEFEPLTRRPQPGALPWSYAQFNSYYIDVLGWDPNETMLATLVLDDNIASLQESDLQVRVNKQARFLFKPFHCNI